MSGQLFGGHGKATCPRIPLARVSGGSGGFLKTTSKRGCSRVEQVHSVQPPMLRLEDLPNERNIKASKPLSAWKLDLGEEQNSPEHVVLPFL